MQFEELIIEGFGPYAGREMVDFTPLSEKGLFSVTGETGAGKTTIFDALTFGLYGRLPGHRPETSVRSDHSSAKQPTQVELVFSASNDRWKVIRSPRQDRPKARGAGTTDKPATAYLYRWVSGQWEPVANKTGEVNDQCRQLIGLDKSQFERVGLLPQGEFKKLLVDKSSDRKLLFRTLFGTDLVDRAVQTLVADAKAAATAAHDALVVHETVAAEAEPLLVELGSVPIPHQIVVLDTGSENDSIIDRLSGATDVVRSHAMPSLLDVEQSARNKANEASAAHGRAGDVLKKLTQRENKRRLRIELDANREAIERDAAAAERARRATPVLDAHRKLGLAQVELDQQTRSCDGSADTVAALAEACEIEVQPSAPDTLTLVDQRHRAITDAARWSAERTKVIATVADHTERMSTCTTALIQLDSQSTEVAEATEQAQAQVERATTAAVRYGELTAGLTPLKGWLDLTRQRETALDQLEGHRTELAQQVATRAEVQESLSTAQSGVDQLRAIEQTIPSVKAELDTARSVAHTFVEIASLTSAVDSASSHHAQAAKDLAIVAASFARTVAPRLAADLRDGEPCAVCGSCEHPAPADSGTGDDATTQTDVDRATTALTCAAAELNRVDALLQATLQTLPKGLTALEADHQLAQLETALTAAQDTIPKRHAAEQQLATLSQQLQGVNQLILEGEATIERLTALVQEAGAELQAGGIDEPSKTLQIQYDEQLAVVDAVKSEADRLEAANGMLAEQAGLAAKIAEQRIALSTEQTRSEENARTALERVAALDERLQNWQDVNFDLGTQRLDQLKAELANLVRLTDARDRTRTRCETLQESFDAAYATAGFPTVDEALAAQLPLDTVAQFEAAADAFRSESDGCDAALAQLAELGLPDEAPDLTGLETELHAASAEATEAIEARTRVEKLISQSLALIERWAQKGEQFASLQAAADSSAAVADLCNAKGASRIGLEGFILRQHLEQVVAMANLRLDPMSRGRYQLVVADQAIKGAGEWGLDLKVIDSHTGGEREVTTLSGGETFYTSLSLALGLSDVLSSRGATAINSVFIDEGFGSLDESAIEDTIEMLNELRSDGITIGIITHVGALRDALPTGIQVEKLPSGGSRVVQAA